MRRPELFTYSSGFLPFSGHTPSETAPVGSALKVEVPGGCIAVVKLFASVARTSGPNASYPEISTYVQAVDCFAKASVSGTAADSPKRPLPVNGATEKVTFFPPQTVAAATVTVPGSAVLHWEAFKTSLLPSELTYGICLRAAGVIVDEDIDEVELHRLMGQLA